jgi:hypothetical protein
MKKIETLRREEKVGSMEQKMSEKVRDVELLERELQQKRVDLKQREERLELYENSLKKVALNYEEEKRRREIIVREEKSSLAEASDEVREMARDMEVERIRHEEMLARSKMVEVRESRVSVYFYS